MFVLQISIPIPQAQHLMKIHKTNRIMTFKIKILSTYLKESFLLHAERAAKFAK